MVAIENIKAGDKVISTNHETFETAEKTVLETYIREATNYTVEISMAAGDEDKHGEVLAFGYTE